MRSRMHARTQRPCKYTVQELASLFSKPTSRQLRADSLMRVICPIHAIITNMYIHPSDRTWLTVGKDVFPTLAASART